MWVKANMKASCSDSNPNQVTLLDVKPGRIGSDWRDTT